MVQTLQHRALHMRNDHAVISITKKRYPEAATLMARAFASDALMRYLFKSEMPGYTIRLRGFFHYTTTVHHTLNWPMLGAIARTRLAGAVFLATPEQAAPSDALTEAFTDFTHLLDVEMLEQIQRYANMKSHGMPDARHFYIKAIGVRPESQGSGYAHALLDAVHRRVDAHPTAQGIGLDTEKPANVPLYQRFGYQLIATVPFNGIDVFYMFRPNNAGRGSAQG